MRVYQIYFLNCIIEDCPRTADLVREHYGWAGRLFVERVLNNADIMKCLKEEYQRLVKLLLSADAGKKINGKHANAIAILMATAIAVRQYVFAGYQLVDIQMEDMLRYIPDDRDISVGKRAYDYILDWVASNLNNFIEEDWRGRSLDEVHGKVYGKIRKNGETLIIRSVLDEVLEDKGYAPEAAYQWMRANGKLKVNDGVSAVYSINGNRVRCVSILTGSQN